MRPKVNGEEAEEEDSFLFGFTAIDMENPYFITLESAIREVIEQCIDNVITLHYNKDERRVCIMAQTTLSVRMDDSLKSDFDKVCNELGLSMTTAITMLAKKMTREKRLPFEVSVDPFYSEENLARLRRSIAQMESTGGTVHEVNLDD